MPEEPQQGSNYTTWRLAKMNLAIRGIDGQIGHGDTFHNDHHPDLNREARPVAPRTDAGRRHRVHTRDKVLVQ